MPGAGGDLLLIEKSVEIHAMRVIVMENPASHRCGFDNSIRQRALSIQFAALFSDGPQWHPDAIRMSTAATKKLRNSYGFASETQPRDAMRMIRTSG